MTENVATPNTRAPPPMWTREGRQDPFTWYRYMRESEPVAYHEPIGAWGVFRYEDVRAIYLDDVNWSVERRFDKLPPDQRGLHILANTMNGVDPPAHARLRMLAMPALSPAQIGKLQERVRQISADLLGEALIKGSFDLIADYAHRLPQSVINEILGVPSSEYAIAKQLSDRMEAATGRYAGAPLTDVEGLRAVNRDYRAYFAPIIEERRLHDHGDVMSSLVRAEEQGDRLSNEELFKMATIINRGGAETTMTLIAQTIRAMIQFPEQYERIRADRNLIPAAIEEVLRFYPPTHSIPRVAVHDVVIGGQLIPQGSTVLMWMASANRDPQVFQDPDKFDVTRTPNRHLSLGFGIHMCIGMHLARLEARTALDQWITRVKTFKRAEEGPIEWSEISLTAVFPRRFPVTVTLNS